MFLGQTPSGSKNWGMNRSSYCKNHFEKGKKLGVHAVVLRYRSGKVAEAFDPFRRAVTQASLFLWFFSGRFLFLKGSDLVVLVTFYKLQRVFLTSVADGSLGGW